jgi:sulfite reductase alpha subunit-like flavoprotein
MDTASIASRITLVTLSTGAWRANKTNKRETLKVNNDHNTDAARVVVRLTDHPSLTALYKLHSEAYTEHKKITLPSIQDGMRVLPAAKQMDHGKLMGVFVARHDQLVSDFLSEYELIRQEAPVKLNGLFDGDQWPDKFVVAGKFKFENRYLPCPNDQGWKEWIEETVSAGQEELKERLVQAARHLGEVLMTDGKLYQSALDNLRDVCDLVGSGFNLMDDPVIADIAKHLRAPASLNAAVLRDDKTSRRSTGDEVARILGTLKI